MISPITWPLFSTHLMISFKCEIKLTIWTLHQKINFFQQRQWTGCANLISLNGYLIAIKCYLVVRCERAAFFRVSLPFILDNKTNIKTKLSNHLWCYILRCFFYCVCVKGLTLNCIFWVDNKGLLRENIFEIFGLYTADTGQSTHPILYYMKQCNKLFFWIKNMKILSPITRPTSNFDGPYTYPFNVLRPKQHR